VVAQCEERNLEMEKSLQRKDRELQKRVTEVGEDNDTKYFTQIQELKHQERELREENLKLKSKLALMQTVTQKQQSFKQQLQHSPQQVSMESEGDALIQHFENLDMADEFNSPALFTRQENNPL
jgi:predicted Holliday junction resolvase-like endonuclease